MIFNVSGGGGAALNFKVLAYATEEELLAATPVENTIGIVTETPITSWIFSATEPSPAAPGMVWISTGTSSLIEFNALKKNGVQVYPISVTQYVSGAWIGKTAKSYQSGAWVDWINYLYKDGNQYTDLTGGWAVYKENNGGYDVSFENDGIEVTYNGAQSNWNASAYTIKKIDVTNYTTLTADVAYIHHYSDSKFILGLNSSPGNTSIFTHSQSLAKTADDTYPVTVDLSDLSGSFYIGFYTKYALVTVNNIRLL